MNNKKLNKPTDFCIGAAVNTGIRPIENQLIPFIKKINAGASFFQTQAVFDTKMLYEFIEEAEKNIPRKKFKIIVGIFLIKSKKLLETMMTLPGVYIPEKFANDLSNSSNELQTGMDYCINIINEIKNLVDGIHIMAVNSEELIPEIIEKTKL